MTINQHREASPTHLPSNWRSLTSEERFIFLRDAPELTRGIKLRDTDIDCVNRSITDLNLGVIFHFNYPGREEGSFVFKVQQGRSVLGDLDFIASRSQPYKRIFILSNTTWNLDAKMEPGGFSHLELKQIANLLETFHSTCSPAQPGRQFDTYVIFADQTH